MPDDKIENGLGTTLFNSSSTYNVINNSSDSVSLLESENPLGNEDTASEKSFVSSSSSGYGASNASHRGVKVMAENEDAASEKSFASSSSSGYGASNASHRGVKVMAGNKSTQSVFSGRRVHHIVKHDTQLLKRLPDNKYEEARSVARDIAQELLPYALPWKKCAEEIKKICDQEGLEASTKSIERCLAVCDDLTDINDLSEEQQAQVATIVERFIEKTKKGLNNNNVELCIITSGILKKNKSHSGRALRDDAKKMFNTLLVADFENSESEKDSRSGSGFMASVGAFFKSSAHKKLSQDTEVKDYFDVLFNQEIDNIKREPEAYADRRPYKSILYSAQNRVSMNLCDVKEGIAECKQKLQGAITKNIISNIDTQISQAVRNLVERMAYKPNKKVASAGIAMMEATARKKVRELLERRMRNGNCLYEFLTRKLLEASNVSESEEAKNKNSQLYKKAQKGAKSLLDLLYLKRDAGEGNQDLDKKGICEDILKEVEKRLNAVQLSEGGLLRSECVSDRADSTPEGELRDQSNFNHGFQEGIEIALQFLLLSNPDFYQSVSDILKKKWVPLRRCEGMTPEEKREEKKRVAYFQECFYSLKESSKSSEAEEAWGLFRQSFANQEFLSRVKYLMEGAPWLKEYLGEFYESATEGGVHALKHDEELTDERKEQILKAQDGCDAICAALASILPSLVMPQQEGMFDTCSVDSSSDTADAGDNKEEKKQIAETKDCADPICTMSKSFNDFSSKKQFDLLQTEAAFGTNSADFRSGAEDGLRIAYDGGEECIIPSGRLDSSVSVSAKPKEIGELINDRVLTLL